MHVVQPKNRRLSILMAQIVSIALALQLLVPFSIALEAQPAFPNLSGKKLVLKPQKKEITIFAESGEAIRLTPLEQRIALCESSGIHYARNGTVLRGRHNPNDIGIMQINTEYHGESAERLGYNLLTVSGNIGYAKHLLKMQNTQPWNASKHCWSSRGV